jgi:NAD(P)-dependent dehydrogenase (short-subunit alcohol dehydrogenase family)
VLGRGVERPRDPGELRISRVDPDSASQTTRSQTTLRSFRPLAAQTALGRIGEPDDIGNVIAALLSDDFGWVTGETIEVSTGFKM